MSASGSARPAEQEARVSISLPVWLVDAVCARDSGSRGPTLDESFLSGLRENFMRARDSILTWERPSKQAVDDLRKARTELRKVCAERVGVRACDIDATKFWDAAAYLRAFNAAKNAAVSEHARRVETLRAKVAELERISQPYLDSVAAYNEALLAYSVAKREAPRTRTEAVSSALKAWLDLPEADAA